MKHLHLSNQNILLLFLFVFLPFQSLANGWDDAKRYLFATSEGAKQVKVIDVKSDKVVGTLETQWPIDEIAVSGFGDFAYLGHGDEKKVSVIDLKNGKVSHVLEVSVAPRKMTNDPNVGVVITDHINGGLALFDTPGKTELFSVPDVAPSEDVIFNTSGTIAYYFSGPKGAVGAVNMQSGKKLWTAQVPKSSQSIPLVRSLDSLFIVFVLPERGEIHALNSSNGQLLASKRFSSDLARPYVTANGQYFLVPEPANKQIHLISQATFAHVASVDMNSEVSLVSAGLFDLVGISYGKNELVAYDLLSFGQKTKNRSKVKGQAVDSVITEDSKHAYAAIPATGEVMHLNIKNGQVSYIKALEGVNLVSMGVSNAVCH